MTYDVAALRAQEYPWMDPATAVHLNSASTGPLPARAVRAVGEFTALRHDPRAMPDTLLFDTGQCGCGRQHHHHRSANRFRHTA